MLGRDVKGMATHRIVALGVALVPEGRAIFGNLSVRENLLLGAFCDRVRCYRQRRAACNFFLAWASVWVRTRARCPAVNSKC